jgi:hypothetical protein
MPETVEYRRALLPALLMRSFSVAFVGVGVWMLYAIVFQQMPRRPALDGDSILFSERIRRQMEICVE